MTGITIAACILIFLAVMCVRILYVLWAIEWVLDMKNRAAYGSMPSFEKMCLYFWRWDPLKITEHTIYLKHRKYRTGPYANVSGYSN